ncbi:helix-turn-helix transcriptional regulator [Streptomyces asoensis]|uniref:Helix-turn-helix transcriptional regulator n=2 Tax=Streptomyces asoensis TaxID=249586 RepID=A0ABQ3SCI8_9ACTN|nr:helix-turn-helix transcriptional regulator [Streptomyces asoensis]GHI65840.1 helix-turn-helix transcriptional regulator [Streptomyces asoensis]
MAGPEQPAATLAPNRSHGFRSPLPVRTVTGMSGQTTHGGGVRVVTGEPGCGRTAFLARAARAYPAAYVVGVRADPVASAVPLGGLRALLRALGAPVVRVDPLSPDEAATLLDEATDGALDRAVRDDLVDAAEGSPALLLGMVRRLSPAQIRGHRRLPAPPADAELLTGLAGHFLTGCTPAQEDLLLTVAAAVRYAHDTQDARIALTLARRAAEQLRGTPPGAQSAHSIGPLPELLVRTDAEVGFHSDLLRRAVYADARPERRRAAHHALARALEETGSTGLPVLLHRARSTAAPGPGTATALAAAADDRTHPRNLRCAAYTHAADLTDDGTRRAQWYTAAAEQALHTGRTHRALRLLDRARDSAAPTALRGRAELIRGTVVLYDGAVDEARASLLLAARLLAESSPHKSESALLAAVDAAWAAGDAQGCLHALTTADTPRPAAHPPTPASAQAQAQAPAPDARNRTELSRDLGYRAGLRALLEGKFAQAAGPLRRLIVDAEAAGAAGAAGADEPDTALRASAAALLLGDLAAARRAGARALAAAGTPGTAAARARAREYLAYAELRAGRHALARTHAEEGLRAAHRTGQRNTAAHHHAVLALAASIEGTPEEVAAHADTALATARRHGLVQAATLAQWAIARADLAGGRPREAADRLGPLVHPGPRRGHFAVWMLAVPCFVEAAASTGRTDDGVTEVADVVEEFARWAGFGADPQAPAQLTRCRALLAPPDRADTLYRRALDLHDAAGGGDFERARTELLHGKWLRRRRRLSEARDRLGAALVGFERCGARVWADQTRAELRAGGVAQSGAGRAPGPGPGLDALTPQQLRITRCVAEGATNREVALTLSLSTRTVDYHLRKVFAALGVRSRIELARMVEKTGQKG